MWPVSSRAITWATIGKCNVSKANLVAVAFENVERTNSRSEFLESRCVSTRIVGETRDIFHSFIASILQKRKKFERTRFGRFREANNALQSFKHFLIGLGLFDYRKVGAAKARQ